MKGSLDDALKAKLRALIVRECDKQVDPDTLRDDRPLFGPQSELQLDSVDALQVSMALQQQFGWKITDPKEARRILVSVNALADHLQPA